ncbi:MAG: hypothetical protein R6W84_03345, partial [Promethearchaeia archaeon]
MNSEQENMLILEGKMDYWGPFEQKEGDWLIFTVGNPEEGHGYALPRNIDDLTAQHIGLKISLRTGSRYVAHIPFTTDYAGDAARDWAPKYMPVAQFIPKVIDFLKFHINTYEKIGLKASKIFIYSGHGGNDPLMDYKDELKNSLKVEKLFIGTGAILEEDINKIREATIKLARDLSDTPEEEKKIGNELVQILLSTGHAGHMEHSMGYALDIMDKEKLEIMNQQLEKNFEETIKKFPPVGGLGGYLLAGGKYEKALGSKRNDKFGLWNCLKTLRKLDKGRIKPYKELGKMVIEMIIDA